MVKKWYEVTTWKNGNSKNACYGIRIKKNDYSNLKNWKELKVGENIIVSSPETKFTVKCPEIRNKHIKKFLEVNNLKHWESRHPHELFLFEYEKNKFQLFPNSRN
jgi:hypothetical protein